MGIIPKQRITKEMVMDAAFCLLREGGETQVLVKSIAKKLGCSVQPIYSYCENMDILRQELSAMAAQIMREYVGERVDKNNYFESTGKAYIAFAKEEPYLFKSYFLRNREGLANFDDLYAAEAGPNMASYISKTHNISEKAARKLHMNMIIFSTGLSFMLISTNGSLPQSELNQKLEYAYKAFLEEAERNGDKI